MAEMGVDKLRNNLTNVARQYLFEVLIPAPIGGGDSETLMVRCQAASIPGRSVGEITVPFKQTPGVKFPGKMTVDHRWECTFVEGEDRAIHEAMYGWAQAVVDDYGGISQGDGNIKRDLYLNLLSTAGEVYQRIKLVGAYVQEIGSVDLSYEQEGYITYRVVFSYDRWEVVTS